MQAEREHMQLVPSGKTLFHLPENVQQVLWPQSSSHLHQCVPGYIADITVAILESLAHLEQEAVCIEKRKKRKGYREGLCRSRSYILPEELL